MSYFYWSLFLNMQGTLFIGVLCQLKSTYFILPWTWPKCCLIHWHLRSSFHLLSISRFYLIFWPLKLKSMIFHLPLRSTSVFINFFKLPLGIECLRLPRIHIGLLHTLEWRIGIGKQWPISVMFPIMEALCAWHPLGYILTIFTG